MANLLNGWHRKEAARVPLKTVVPADPFGTTSKYRELRILLARPREQYVALCWLRRATDGSLSFGFSGRITVEHVGIAHNTGLALEVRGDPEQVTSPMNTRRNVHATLHPSGICQVRAEKNAPLFTHNLECRPARARPGESLRYGAPRFARHPSAPALPRATGLSASCGSRSSRCLRLPALHSNFRGGKCLTYIGREGQG